MSIVIVRQPDEISFSKNPIVYNLQSDARIDNPGAAAVNVLEFVGPIAEGSVVVLRWKNEEQRMVAKNVVTNPGFEFPAGTPSLSYMLTILACFQDNFYLDRDFTMERITTGLFTTPRYYIQFTAKEPGRDSQFIPQSTPSLKLTIKTPGIDPVVKPNFRLHVQLYVEKADGSSFQKVYGEELETEESGKVEWDIADLLHPELSPDFHVWSGKHLDKDINSKRRYYIRYAEGYGVRFQIGKIFDGPIKHVTMGGTPYESGPAVSVLDLMQEGTDVARDRALRYGPDVRYVFPDAPGFLTFLNTRDGYNDFKLKVTAKMSFSGYADVLSITMGSLAKFERATANVGYAQLGLNALVDTNAVEQYTCQFYNGTIPVSRPYTFVLDYSNKPYRRFFTYHNSLGAFDSIHIWGKGSQEIDLTKQTAKKYKSPDYAYTDGVYVDWDLTYRQKFEAATGYRLRQEIRGFRDFYISRYKHRFFNEKALPITIQSSSLKEYEDASNLFAQSFEYAYQYDDDTVSEDLDTTQSAYAPPPGFTGATGGPVVIQVPPAPGYGTGGEQLFDQTPTKGSSNTPRSGGVWSAIQNLQPILPIGSIGQYIRGDHSIGNFNLDVDPLIVNRLIKFKAEELPKFITSDNSSLRIAADQIADPALGSGLFYAPAITKTSGWPVDSVGGSLVRVINGEPGLRKGNETVQTNEGQTFVRTISDADGPGEWNEITAGEEPTFQNIPKFRFPIGQLTTQVIDLGKYLVTTNTHLKMEELSRPDFVQSLQIDGLKATITSLPTDSKEKGVVLEVTDLDTGKSRTVSVPITPRVPVSAKFNLYNAITSAVVAEIPQDGSGSFVNLEKLDIQFVIDTEPHDGVYAAIVGGGPNGSAINEKWTDGEFEQLAEVKNGGTYRMWSYVNGKSVPAGHYTVLFKAFLGGVEIYSKSVQFEITAQNIAQADFEMWDEAIGIGYKVADIKADNTSVFQPITKGDIHFSVKNILHNQVFARIKKDGTEIFSWGTPHENVTQAESAIYQLFGPSGNHNMDAGVYEVEYFAFLNNVQVFTKDSTFTISADTTPVVVGRFEFWNEDGTPAKVGDILFNNTSSFAAIPKCDIRFNLFNIDHNQVYAELRNSAGVAIASFGKPYETVPQAQNAVYQMFGSGYGTNIAAGAYSAYFVAKKDGNTVYEKTASFILTSTDIPSNGISPIQLKNVTSGAIIGNIAASGSSYPMPGLWDVGCTVVDRPHDYYSFILDKEINGTYDNNNVWLNQASNLTPASGSVTRYVFDNLGNTTYENANIILREGKYKLVFTIKSGGATGIIVATTTVIFTLTTNTDVPDSGLQFFRYDNGTNASVTTAVPVSGGKFALQKEAPSIWDIGYNWSSVTTPYNYIGKKLEVWKDGAFVDINIASLLQYSDHLDISAGNYAYSLLTPRSLNNQMLLNGKSILYSDNRFRATFTLRNGGATGTIVQQKQADFSVYVQGNETLAPFSQTPKKRITIKNVNGVYSDIEPGETVTNGVRYRTENGRTYKVFYWLNELPWAGPGDVAKDLGEVAIPNGLLISIRKVYADVTWIGSTTFQNFTSHGWDFWMHGGENPNADFNLELATVLLNFTTNGGVNLDTGSTIRHQNPAWLVANQSVPQFFLNASPYARAPKPVCIQCVPRTDDIQETVNRLADGGVSHIFWQNLHSAGMYEVSTGEPKPGLNMRGILPCFNLASQDIYNGVKSATGVSLAVNQQCTRDQARAAANTIKLIAGAVYTDEFSEGSYPQTSQSREWFYERIHERLTELGITVIFAGDYGYGSQNLRINNPADSAYMRSLMTSNVVDNLENVGGSNHTSYKQYVQYFAVNRDTVMGAYYAINSHPLYRRMNGLPIEAIISINATNTIGGRKKVRFCATLMQSNGNGTDVPQKDSGTIMPNGSVTYDYPAAPFEIMRMDGFFNRFFYDAGYIWDAWGVRNVNDVNNWIGMNTGMDAWIEGCRLYDRIYPYLVQAGMDMFASDYTSNGTAFNSTTTERRISRVGTSYFNNIYFNQAIDAGKGCAITIRGNKKVFIYWNCNLHVNQKERVIISDNGTNYDIGEVAGNTLCVAFES